MTLNTQLLTMISMIVGGIYLGFATETFRRISVIWNSKKILTFIAEILYWVFQTCILFLVLFQVNDGELRAYIFLACLLGFSMYVVMFKTIYKRVLEWIIKVLVALTKGIIKILNTLIIRPIRWIIELLLRIVYYIGYLCYRILRFIFNILFYPFRLLFSYIRKLIPEKVWNKVTKLVAFCSTIIYKLKKWLKNVIDKRR